MQHLVSVFLNLNKSYKNVYVFSQGYTGYTVLLGYRWVNMMHRGIQYYWGIHGLTGYIGVYRITMVYMG